MQKLSQPSKSFLSHQISSLVVIFLPLYQYVEPNYEVCVRHLSSLIIIYRLILIIDWQFDHHIFNISHQHGIIIIYSSSNFGINFHTPHITRRMFLMCHLSEHFHRPYSSWEKLSYLRLTGIFGIKTKLFLSKRNHWINNYNRSSGILHIVSYCLVVYLYYGG